MAADFRYYHVHTTFDRSLKHRKHNSTHQHT